MLHDKPHRILVAEDNELNQLVIQELLRHRGYEVEVVGGGHEAFAALKRASYSLLILDCMMPGLDGFATSRMIRSETSPGFDRAIPILATTALSSDSDRQMCLDSGMDDYLCKPIMAKVLFEYVERLIAGRSNPQQTDDTAAVPTIDEKQDSASRVEIIVASMSSKVVREVRDWETELGKLFEGQDWIAIRNLAHKIRGTADVMGFPALSSHTAALEQAAAAGDEPVINKILTVVISELQKMRDKLGQRK